MVDLNREEGLTQEASDVIDDMFTYHPWEPPKIEKGRAVRDALIAACRVILSNVPPCPDRSTALHKLREARMDCNSAITFDGRY